MQMRKSEGELNRTTVRSTRSEQHREVKYPSNEADTG